MPFKVSFTDDAGTNHPNSFWILHVASINLTGQTGLLIYHGWHDAAAFVASDAIVGERVYNINDPFTFEVNFGLGRVKNERAFYAQLDLYIQSSDELFNIDTAIHYSYLPLSVTSPPFVGFYGPSRIVVAWAGEIDSAGSWTTGITIEINGIPATISTTSHTPGTGAVYYDIAEEIKAQDVVTFEYDASGDLLGDDGEPLAPILPQTVENQVGSFLIFSNKYNSGHIFFPLGV